MIYFTLLGYCLIADGDTLPRRHSTERPMPDPSTIYIYAYRATGSHHRPSPRTMERSRGGMRGVNIWEEGKGGEEMKERRRREYPRTALPSSEIIHRPRSHRRQLGGRIRPRPLLGAVAQYAPVGGRDGLLGGRFVPAQVLHGLLVGLGSIDPAEADPAALPF